GWRKKPGILSSALSSSSCRKRGLTKARIPDCGLNCLMLGAATAADHFDVEVSASIPARGQWRLNQERHHSRGRRIELPTNAIHLLQECFNLLAGRADIGIAVSRVVQIFAYFVRGLG